jgi:imidazolonepropionase-like amidohydrolase
VYTINAAYQNHQERETGSIEVGRGGDSLRQGAEGLEVTSRK